MRRRLAKLLALPWQDQALVVEAMLTLVAVKVCLRVGGLNACTAVIGSVGTSQGAPPSDMGLARIALAVRRASRPLALTCLPQSLAVIWLLKRRGIAAELHFGARTFAGTLDAHAWVTVPAFGWTFDLCPEGRYACLHEAMPG